MNHTTYKKLFSKISAVAEKKLSNNPGCHDWDHTARVLRNSQIICRGERRADKKVVEIASLLHDISRSSDMHGKGKKCHALSGAKIARKILEKISFLNGEFVDKVCLCVKRHRFRGDDPPISIEEKIVYDADKLDSLGAVGIGRAFHFAGRIGARLHNTEKEALESSSYSRNDSAYREYLVKMRYLPSKMLTKTGRKLAKRRADYMKKFFEEMERETGS